MTNEEAQKKLEAIMDLCEELGWDILIGRNQKTEEIEGLIVGVEPYLQDIVEHLSDNKDVILKEIEDTDPSFH